MHTEDDILAGYADLMGKPLADRFYEIEQDVDWLQMKWSTFKDLFDSGQARIDLLNKVAPNFFYMLKKFLFEDAMLNLCRLTDPPKTLGRHENLTIFTLAEAVLDTKLRASVGATAALAKQNCEFARQWRDKTLAHTDLHVFRTGRVSLPDVDSKHIEDAIRALRKILNEIREHYGALPVGFLRSDPYGAPALMHYVERGVESEEKEIANRQP